MKGRTGVLTMAFVAILSVASGLSLAHDSAHSAQKTGKINAMYEEQTPMAGTANLASHNGPVQLRRWVKDAPDPPENIHDREEDFADRTEQEEVFGDTRHDGGHHNTRDDWRERREDRHDYAYDLKVNSRTRLHHNGA